jgi:hypothetical protein
LVCDETVRRWTRQDLPTGPSVRRNAPRLGALGSHFSLRPSAYLCVLCVNGNFNAEDAEIRRGPQRKRITFGLFVQSPSKYRAQSTKTRSGSAGSRHVLRRLSPN